MADVLKIAIIVAIFARPALAEQREPVTEVAAAISLAQAGVGAQNASLILTALEVLNSYAPMGQDIAALRAAYKSEAKFLMRGDAALQTRLLAIQEHDADAGSDGPKILVVPFADRLTVPERHNVIALAGTMGSVLHSAHDANGQACRPRFATWRCGFAPGQGVLTLDGHATEPAWIVIELVRAEE